MTKTDGGGFTSSGGGFRKPRPAPLPFNGYRALAIAVVVDAIETLREPAPKDARKRRRHEARRAFEVAFFRDRNRASKWCEMAGYDRDAIVSKLVKLGLLEPPAMPLEEAAAVLAEREPRPPVRHGNKGGRPPRRDRGIRRLLAKLPRFERTACTAAEIATSIGTTTTYVRDALATLERDGRARCVADAALGRKSARRWWRGTP